MVDNLEQFKDFVFIDPGSMIDNELKLKLGATFPYNPDKGHVPAYQFVMTNTYTNAVMGGIDLRVGLTEKLKEYGGHIGYRVHEPYRGHRYAARSCRLLLPLIQKLDINPVVITCDPDNLPSVRTIESLGAALIATKDVQIEPGIIRPTKIYHLHL